MLIIQISVRIFAPLLKGVKGKIIKPSAKLTHPSLH